MSELLTERKGNVPYKERVGGSSPSAPKYTLEVERFFKALLKGHVKGRYYAKTTAHDYARYVQRYVERYAEWDASNVTKYILSIATPKKEARLKAWKALKCYALFTGNTFPKDLQMPEGNRNPARSYLKEAQVKALYDACETQSERLCLLLYYTVGVRRYEGVSIKWRDVDMEKRTITITEAKGGKERQVGIPNELHELLLEIGPKTRGYVLPYQSTGVRKTLNRIGARVGIRVTPHMLRRSFVTHNLRKGRSIAILQRAAGHASIATTELYNRLESTEVIEEMSTW